MTSEVGDVAGRARWVRRVTAAPTVGDLAAGYAPVYGETPLDAEEMAAVRGALDEILAGHAPYPALIADRRWLRSLGRELRLFSTLATSGTALAELAIESFFPADPETEPALRDAFG